MAADATGTTLEKLKTKLSQLRGQRTEVEKELARKEALLNDATVRLQSEFGVRTVAEGQEALEVMQGKATKLRAQLDALIEEAERVLGRIDDGSS